MHLNIQQQRGVVLLTSLSFLVIITIIAVSAMRSSNSDLRIAGVHEENMAARQVAQAAIDNIMENYESNFTVTGNVGTTATATPTTDLPAFSYTQMTLTEKGIKSPPRGLGVSKDKFATALFEVRSVYDDTGNNKGRQELNQGMLLLIQKI